MRTNERAWITRVLVSKTGSGRNANTCYSATPMRVPLLLALFLAMVLLGSLSAQAQAVYCVRAGASGANNGSDWNNAYTSLPATLERGATYYVAVGSYPGYTFNTPNSGSTYITIKKATMAEHGTNTDWQDSYGDGQAIFPNITFSSGYWTFDGVTGGGPYSWKTGHGFKIGGAGVCHPVAFAGANYVQVKHTEVYSNLSSSCAGLDGANFGNRMAGGNMNHITISYCYAHHNWLALFDYGSDGITVEYSYLENNGQAGLNDSLHRELWSTWGGVNLTFRYNYAKNFFGTGHICQMNGSTNPNNWGIYGNVFWNENSPGNYPWRTGDGTIAIKQTYTGNDIKIYNNTFVGIYGNATGSTNGIPPTNSYVYNNLYYANVCQYLPWNAPGAKQDYGWAYNNHNYYNGGGASTDSQIGSQAHGVVGTSDPFIDSANGDFRLKYSIPGLALGAPYDKDMLGSTQGADGVWDRGAFQYTGGGISPPQNLHIVLQ